MYGRTNVRSQAGRRLARAVVHLCACAFVMSGCVRARAKSLPNLPALEVPAPPPRIVLPIQTQTEAEPPSPGPAEEPRRPSPAPARPRTSPPVEPPRVAEEPRPLATPPAAPAPPPTLQTTPAAEQGEVERAIRVTMARATADLNRIDYRALNADARSQYDTAKRFVQQADDAIRLKNLPFAKNLADKAAALAVQLGER
jgi:hypothetical protein